MLQNEMVIRIDADIRDIKGKFQELQSTVKQRLSGIEANFKGLKASITDVGSSLRNTFLEVGRYVGAFVAVYYGIKSVTWGLESLVKITDRYAKQVAEVAALLTTHTQLKPGQDVAIVFREWYEYASLVYEKLAEMDEQFLGTRDEVMQMVAVLAQYGVVVDINNQKQLEGLRNIHNAIKIITQDQQEERQLRQELNALMQGKVDQASRLMQILKSMDPQIESNIAKWRAQKTLLENIGNLLQGFAQSTATIENLYEAQKTTLESILQDIFR
ncbi:MAG: hypothetical protein RMJ39_10430, partial [Deltaproteobacteria bacterium]|nr:hypothetical protein [Deltaproteobacteria bacterium]